MIYMNDEALDSPSAIKAFLTSSGKLDLRIPEKERYGWLQRTLKRTNYYKLGKKEKAIVREYMQRVSQYSRAQLTRLITTYRINYCIKRKPTARHHFPCRYTRSDILLLAKTDKAHQTLSGALTKNLIHI